MCGFENEIVVKYDQTEIILKIKFTSYNHKNIFLKYWNLLHMADLCTMVMLYFMRNLIIIWTTCTKCTQVKFFFKLATSLNVEYFNYLVKLFYAFW